MQAAYDSIANWYDAWVRDETSVDNATVSTFLDFIGAVDNQLICDVACGQGRVARALAQRNARVVGVDISSQLIGIAQREEQQVPLGIEYFLDDAQTLTQLGDCTFDGATSYLALMDIPDLEALCHAVYRILRPKGWFGFAITHPCFESQQWQCLQRSVSNSKLLLRSKAFWELHELETFCCSVGSVYPLQAIFNPNISRSCFIYGSKRCNISKFFSQKCN